ncbi:hypothetical protein KP79_PYT24155 [Mizuhopecten yessoensis]|uniref:SGNH hydrolase-type esterase domain-containing protein n=1 Tax=Mizuhopecten yessoensis TaxID=6573 RepID=A0A210Q9U1_MIZYE|nr:hypothetical protein KP79_PYT24155 [Mizuhopecten yessoensis]
MRTDTIPNWMMTHGRAFDGDAVLIQLGGNDIRQNSNPREIFNRLSVLEETLAEKGAAVYIAEICRRGDFSKAPGLSAESFNKQRNAINRFLRTKYGTRVIRVPLQYPADYDDTLVHFSEAGIRKYFFVVRRFFSRGYPDI